TLNAISGLGMLAVGIIGNPLLGNVQDRAVDKQLQAKAPAIHEKIAGDPKPSIFGEYRPIDQVKLSKLSEAESTEVKKTKEEGTKTALQTVAMFPIGMFVAFVLLLLYFTATGGYKPVTLDGQPATSGH
ncbi:MAG: MFS transporter, partial [Gemmataceae bacterium]